MNVTESLYQNVNENNVCITKCLGATYYMFIVVIKNEKNI